MSLKITHNAVMPAVAHDSSLGGSTWYVQSYLSGHDAYPMVLDLNHPDYNAPLYLNRERAETLIRLLELAIADLDRRDK